MLTHQVVEEDVGGLSRKISDVQQELPQHVHQLVLETTGGKHKDKVWCVCVCTGACMTASPTCRLLTVSFSRKCRRTSAGSSIRQFHRICWATALTDGTTQYNKVRVGCHSICPHHIHTHSCCTITWETNSTHSRMAVG